MVQSDTATATAGPEVTQSDTPAPRRRGRPPKVACQALAAMSRSPSLNLSSLELALHSALACPSPPALHSALACPSPPALHSAPACPSAPALHSAPACPPHLSYPHRPAVRAPIPLQIMLPLPRPTLPLPHLLMWPLLPHPLRQPPLLPPLLVRGLASGGTVAGASSLSDGLVVVSTPATAARHPSCSTAIDVRHPSCSTVTATSHPSYSRATPSSQPAGSPHITAALQHQQGRLPPKALFLIPGTLRSPLHLHLHLWACLVFGAAASRVFAALSAECGVTSVAQGAAQLCCSLLLGRLSSSKPKGEERAPRCCDSGVQGPAGTRCSGSGMQGRAAAGWAGECGHRHCRSLLSPLAPLWSAGLNAVAGSGSGMGLACSGSSMVRAWPPRLLPAGYALSSKYGVRPLPRPARLGCL